MVNQQAARQDEGPQKSIELLRPSKAISSREDKRPVYQALIFAAALANHLDIALDSAHRQGLGFKRRAAIRPRPAPEEGSSRGREGHLAHCNGAETEHPAHRRRSGAG
jgi:hypothetical protein